VDGSRVDGWGALLRLTRRRPAPLAVCASWSASAPSDLACKRLEWSSCSFESNSMLCAVQCACVYALFMFLSRGM